MAPDNGIHIGMEEITLKQMRGDSKYGRWWKTFTDWEDWLFMVSQARKEYGWATRNQHEQS